jgi:hypothetical protein
VVAFMQLVQFDKDGVEGSGWVLSFLVGALAFLAPASRRPLPSAIQRPDGPNPSEAKIDAAQAALREQAK